MNNETRALYLALNDRAYEIIGSPDYHSQAHTSHESGVSASGRVAPSPSRHRRSEGGEMRCNRRRRQKVL